MRGDWDSRLDQIRTGFRALQADIVTLQETILTERVDRPSRRLAPLPPAHASGENLTGRESGLRARRPIGRVLEIDLHAAASGTVARHATPAGPYRTQASPSIRRAPVTYVPANLHQFGPDEAVDDLDAAASLFAEGGSPVPVVPSWSRRPP